jgi:hypothetical protein
LRYALAVVMTFLTTIDAVPMFSDAIERLMRGSLVRVAPSLFSEQLVTLTRRSTLSWTAALVGLVPLLVPGSFRKFVG